jgi:CheY-like chemotaxis protein/predicted transcriptional regulator
MLRGSFSFIVAKRILSALEHNGPTKKTGLAVNSRLNYNVCLKYINMLKLLGWIDITHDKWTFVTITELGREVNGRLFHYDGLDIESPVVEEKSHAPQIATPSKLQDRPSTKHKTKGFKGNIMLVDDESDILLTYRSFLSPIGYNVEGFLDPYSALQKVASSKLEYFDLVILDIRMPEINGLQLYQSLKIMTPSSKFLFVSSLDAAKELVTILPGVSQEQVLQKPLNKEYFVKRVESILSG